MTTLAALPQYPVPALVADVVFTLTQASTNFVRVWCVTAPTGSKLDTELKKSDATSPRVKVYEGTGGSNQTWQLTPDVGGTYSLVAQEYAKGTAFTGGYDGDTRANQVETKVGSEASLALYVGQKLTCQVGTSQDHATLTFYVFNDTIRQTTIATHGIATPSLDSPTSPRAKTAVRTAAVSAAVTALIGVTAENARGSDTAIATLVADIFNKTAGHYVLGTAHPHTDTYNAIGVSFLPNAIAPDSVPLFLNQALKSLKQHYTNDKDGTGPGSASGIEFHKSGLSDLVNATLVRSANDGNDDLNALADIVGSYEAHRVDTTVHTTADTTNTINAAIPPIIDIMRKFFAAVRASTPGAAAGDSSGAALLRAWGFKEA